MGTEFDGLSLPAAGNGVGNGVGAWMQNRKERFNVGDFEKYAKLKRGCHMRATTPFFILELGGTFSE